MAEEELNALHREPQMPLLPAQYVARGEGVNHPCLHDQVLLALPERGSIAIQKRQETTVIAVNPMLLPEGQNRFQQMSAEVHPAQLEATQRISRRYRRL